MSTNKKTYTVKKAKKRPAEQNAPLTELIPWLIPCILVFVALFFMLCLIATEFTGWLGGQVKLILLSLFSWSAYIIPVLLIIKAFVLKKEIQEGKNARNSIFSLLFIVCLSALIATPDFKGGNMVEGFKIAEHFRATVLDGVITRNSVFGGMLSNALSAIIGGLTTFILLTIATVFLSPFTISKSPVDLIRFFAKKFRDSKQKAIKIKESINEKAERKKEELSQQKIEIEPDEEPRRKKNFDFNVEVPGDVKPDIEEDDDEYEDELDDYVFGESEASLREVPSEQSSLRSIFTIKADPKSAEAFKAEDDEGLEEIATDTDIGMSKDIDSDVEEIDIAKKDDEPAVPEYIFPPIHLLKKATPPSQELNSEYENTAKKLVDTLSSFGVKTKILNIAKGPTVTRYELQPEIGVRVRSIRNLSDDIALSLASKGVRIEAPIPGKEAVGIEVPNKNTAIVSIRTLIESSQFESSKSKLTTCLGVDVAGNPVFCDLSKMPHMMIAGTTGSGKSVCINSILMSLLYKAKPDEVKLILIDPKKIELGVYNGIAHLLVPVVSDPKNAAGALSWSVNEMERRFALIEETGVRDIKAYNEVALRDGTKEVLPQIVIIIDELADLMMTARDTVESSIARIAQKARAAGMHLVIGTQRPSVDVITGLIKANVPSRIAFTVASQVDSRTIIDTVGAEKLVGRGDMLYAPVGATTPLRVQGSFVSDSEIESVITFLKEGNRASYSEEIMDSIEKEAAKCEKSKSKMLEDDEFGDDEDSSLNSDPMLRPAIEIALDNGTISTSMLQRKLKLGYARAARLIDKMEALGVVSEFAGSKPRTVLISREKYMEMVVNSEN